MVQISLTGTVSYAPDCAFCNLKIDDVATGEYKSYLTRTAKKGTWPEDPRVDSGRIVARCPVCEIEFVSTVYDFPDETIEKLKEAWIAEDFSAEGSS